MELSELRKYVSSIGLPPGYSISTDKDKGSEITGFDQLTVHWKDHDILKSIQISPEVSDMKIKRWRLGIYAWIDDGQGRRRWTDETLIVKKRKADLIAIAIVEMKKASERLKEISVYDLKPVKH